MLNDVRMALRTLRRSPEFTTIAVATFALATAVTTTMFSVVYGVLLRPLPLRDPQRVVVVDAWSRQFEGREIRGNFSLADSSYWRDRSRAFEAISLTSYESMTLASSAGSEAVLASLVTPGFSEAVGAPMAAGRGFTNADDEVPVAILTARLARRLFPTGAAAVGGRLRLNSRNYTVVGVTEESFRVFNSRVDLWLTAGFARTLDAQLANPRAGGFNPVARLKPGVTLIQAQEDVDAVMRGFALEKPEAFARARAVVVPLSDRLAGDVRSVLLILMVAVGLVLAVACVNIVNLLLARAVARSREMAIRQSLGASRFRLARGAIAESLVTAFGGACAGTTLAYWITAVFVRLQPAGIPKLEAIRVDEPVLAFTAVVTIATALIVGLVPAVHRPESGELLRASTPTGAPRVRGMRRMLVVAELAISIALLAGASLLGRSLVRLMATDIGIATDHLAQALVVLSLEQDVAPERRVKLVDRIVEQVSAIPGVEAAGVTASLPPNRPRSRVSFKAEDSSTGAITDYLLDSVATTPGFFAATRLPLLRGRWLTTADGATAPPVMLVSGRTARRFFPNRDPIGLALPLGDDLPDGRRTGVTVVGVVGDVKYNGMDAPADGAIYRPYTQLPTPSVFVVARTTRDASAMEPTLRRTLGLIDPGVTINSVGTVDGLVADAVAQPRFRTTALLTFAALTLALAAVGLYGAVSYSVSQRTAEIGLRMALGARRTDVVGMIMAEGFRLTAVGLVTGMGASFLFGRALSALLYGVTPTDPLSFVAAAGTLTLVAVIATYAPARRAARVDPLVALRHE